MSIQLWVMIPKKGWHDWKGEEQFILYPRSSDTLFFMNIWIILNTVYDIKNFKHYLNIKRLNLKIKQQSVYYF